MTIYFKIIIEYLINNWVKDYEKTKSLDRSLSKPISCCKGATFLEF